MTQLSINESLQVLLEIVAENSADINLKVIEALSDNCEPLASTIQAVLKDHPLIQPYFKVLTNRNLELEDVLVENETLATESDCNLVIAAHLSQNDYVSRRYFY